MLSSLCHMTRPPLGPLDVPNHCQKGRVSMKRTPSKPFFLRLLDDWVVDISAALALAGTLLVMWVR